MDFDEMPEDMNLTYTVTVTFTERDQGPLMRIHVRSEHKDLGAYNNDEAKGLRMDDLAKQIGNRIILDAVAERRIMQKVERRDAVRNATET